MPEAADPTPHTDDSSLHFDLIHSNTDSTLLAVPDDRHSSLASSFSTLFNWPEETCRARTYGNNSFRLVFDAPLASLSTIVDTMNVMCSSGGASSSKVVNID